MMQKRLRPAPAWLGLLAGSTSRSGARGAYHADPDFVPFTPAAHAPAVAVPPEALTEPA